MIDSGGDSDLRAKLVDRPTDLDELRVVLAKANGRLTSARRGVGDEILIRIRPPHDAASGDWRVGTQASDWVLASHVSVLAGAHASRETIDAAIEDLEGAEVSRLEVTDAAALVLVLSDGRWLEVEGSVNDPDELEDDPPYWEVFTPTNELLRVGPGPIWVRSPARAQGPDKHPRLLLDGLDDEALLKLWTNLTAELRKRGVVTRTHEALADVAEEMVRKHFGGFRGSYERAGWDVLTESGERIEVKALRQRPGTKHLPPLMLRVGDFDAVVVVVLDENFSVGGAWHVPREVALAHLSAPTGRSRMQRLPLRQVLRHPAVRVLDLG